MATFAPLDQLTDDNFVVSLNNKLMGQVNLVRLGCRYVRDNESFTVTSGVLSREPMKGSASISLVNAGLDGFVRAAALELPRGIRINAVSPIWVKERCRLCAWRARTACPRSRSRWPYVESVEGTQDGAVLDTRAFGAS